MTDEKKKIAAVPFDTFERYLGPRYENVPGVDFILENGTLLYFMEEAPGIYVSADHTATGQPDTPKLYIPVYEADAMQPSAFQEIGLREKFAGILETSVPVGLPGVNRRQESGYVLANGLVLLESERDGRGNYRAGAGMDGMYLQTERVFAPIQREDGQTVGFLETEQAREQARVNVGYTIIDSIQAGRVEFVLGENLKEPSPYVTWRRSPDAAPTDFDWGHYFSDIDRARADLHRRAREELSQGREEKPQSIRAQLRGMQTERGAYQGQAPVEQKER